MIIFSEEIKLTILKVSEMSEKEFINRGQCGRIATGIGMEP